MKTQIWNLVDLASIPAEPWRNGGGTTQTMLAWPTVVDWQIRCSVAQVDAAGPFSSFAGVGRWFAVLQGAGVVLTIDGVVHTLSAASQPLQFDGGSKTDCTLIGGTTQDFNFMLRGRKAQTGQMVRVQGEQNFTAQPMQWLGVYALGSDTHISVTSEPAVHVPQGHLAWRLFDQAASLTLNTHHALWMQSHHETH